MPNDIVERLRSAARWGTMTSEFEATVRIEWMAAAEIESLRSRLADLEAERTLIVQRAENAEAALAEADERHSRYVKAVGELAGMAARLAEAERNEGTLLGMIHHQRDVLRECLPYLNESMAGKRPGRSADDIRAAVKALTSASADGPKGEK